MSSLMLNKVHIIFAKRSKPEDLRNITLLSRTLDRLHRHLVEAAKTNRLPPRRKLVKYVSWAMKWLGLLNDL